MSPTVARTTAVSTNFELGSRLNWAREPTNSLPTYPLRYFCEGFTEKLVGGVGSSSRAAIGGHGDLKFGDRRCAFLLPRPAIDFPDGKRGSRQS